MRVFNPLLVSGGSTPSRGTKKYKGGFTMENYMGFPCCRRIAGPEKIVEILIDTYGLENLRSNIEQLIGVGINVKCPFCKTVCWVEPPPLAVYQVIDSSIPVSH